MTLFDEAQALATFIAFCRIGACLMVAPGFSSPRIPMRVRLFLAIGLTAGFAPLLLRERAEFPHIASTVDLVAAIVSQTVIGLVLGLTSRLIVSALETMAVAASMSIGLTSSFAMRIDEAESLPELANFVAFATTALIFLSDLHWTMVGALIESFRAFPIGHGLSADLALSQIVRTLAFGFPLALRIAMPFLAFGIVVNFALALVNRIAPQIPMYFVSAPFLLAAGTGLLLMVAKPMMAVFLAGLSDWVVRN